MSTATEKSRSHEDWRRENEAFADAIQNCDEATYAEITSILRAAGLLHE